jgi:hypothetical protein
MRGTVGAGKSVYVKKMEELLTNAKMTYHVLSTDRHCMDGHSMKTAVNLTKGEVSTFMSINSREKVLIVDTCNDTFNKSNVFGGNFSNWKVKYVWVNYDRSDLDGYLAWSLRNVIRRKDGDSYLTPHGAGIQVCINVHTKKAKRLFGKKNVISPIEYSPGMTIESIISQLDEKADKYEETVKSKTNFVPSLSILNK